VKRVRGGVAGDNGRAAGGVPDAGVAGQAPAQDAHAALAAYGFDGKKDLLAQLLELNLAVAAKETAGEPVTPPGVPASYGGAAKLMTDDCIKP
jgi:hypothetical protein